MKRDQKFFDMYTLVIGLLAVFALAIFILAMKMSGVTQDIYTSDTDDYRAEVERRLKPFGRVYLPGDELAAGELQVPVAEEPAPVEAGLTGAQVYNQACNVCHGNGIGGAPMLSDAGSWEPRMAQGADVLKDHAVNGFGGSAGFMPPRGGNATLSDAEVHSAVDFMLAEIARN